MQSLAKLTILLLPGLIALLIPVRALSQNPDPITILKNLPPVYQTDFGQKLSGYHFSPTPEACADVLALFPDLDAGIAKLIELRLAGYSMISNGAQRCLLYFTSRSDVRAALMSDLDVANRSLWVKFTVGGIVSPVKIEPGFARQFVTRIETSPLALSHRQELLEIIVQPTFEKNVSSELRQIALKAKQRLERP